MDSIKRFPLYVWAYRRKEQLRKLVKYKLPLQLHTWRTAMRERPLLLEARKKYEHLYLNGNSPLVSVTIATYNRGKLLTERTLPSVLNQTYQNFEIVIVGDCCTDDTAERLAKLNDPRIRFYNLSQRGPYPADRFSRWCVAGVPPMNYALEHVQGDWIAHLDDDDIWIGNHLERLLEYAYEENAEVVSSLSLLQKSDEEWILLPSRVERRLRLFSAHSSYLIRRYLKLFKYYDKAWRFGTGADRHLFLRMAYAGVRYKRLPEITVVCPLRPNTSQFGSLAEDRDSL